MNMLTAFIQERKIMIQEPNNLTLQIKELEKDKNHHGGT